MLLDRKLNLFVLNLTVLWEYAMLAAKQVGILYKPVYTLHYTTAWDRWRGKEPWEEAMTETFHQIRLRGEVGMDGGQD